jgi:hypothetical protein
MTSFLSFEHLFRVVVSSHIKIQSSTDIFVAFYQHASNFEIPRGSALRCCQSILLDRTEVV